MPERNEETTTGKKYVRFTFLEMMSGSRSKDMTILRIKCGWNGGVRQAIWTYAVIERQTQDVCVWMAKVLLTRQLETGQAPGVEPTHQQPQHSSYAHLHRQHGGLVGDAMTTIAEHRTQAYGSRAQG